MVATRGSQGSHAITPSSRAVDAAHFWAKVDKTAGLFGCWPFLGGKDRDGYGRYRVGLTLRSAHRTAFALANEREPELSVLHTCDNPPCCQPLHLYEGTQQQNMRDREERGRTPRGTRNGRYQHGRFSGERIPGTRLRAAAHPELLNATASGASTAQASIRVEASPAVPNESASFGTQRTPAAGTSTVPAPAHGELYAGIQSTST